MQLVVGRARSVHHGLRLPSALLRRLRAESPEGGRRLRPRLLHLDLARLGLFALRQSDGQDAVLEGSGDLGGVGVGRELEGPRELAEAALDAVVALTLGGLGEGALTGEGQAVVFDGQSEVLFGQARKIDLDAVLLLALAEVDGRCEGALRALAEALGGRGGEEAVVKELVDEVCEGGGKCEEVRSCLVSCDS